jgi:hypothetical protein
MVRELVVFATIVNEVNMRLRLPGVSREWRPAVIADAAVRWNRHARA